MNANDGKPEAGRKQIIKMKVRPQVNGLNNPALISSKERLRIEVIWDSAVRTEVQPALPGDS